MSRYDEVQAELRKNRRTWLVTGVAGFIGSNLLEKLLLLDQNVVGLDNFSTGHRRNLDEVKTLVTPRQWSRFRFAEGDICRLEDCQRACEGVDYVLHQAALGSVPRSLEDPLSSHASNVDGFLNMLVAVRDARIKCFVYASSSSVYGDHPDLPKVEEQNGKPLSPYGATKLINEIYADVFQRCYGLAIVGLRYFNVFGPRQDPEGAYAAVIPKWFATMLNGCDVQINGDGGTSRDFCHVENIVQANLLAATNSPVLTHSSIYNIACGERTTLLELYSLIHALVVERRPDLANRRPVFGLERAGDVKHSLADISLVGQRLGYAPTHTIQTGLAAAAEWYARGAVGAG
jgi:UDP-N-acetylglucosamine/UDP-N-acetylgalactosamine 4-epimerase